MASQGPSGRVAESIHNFDLLLEPQNKGCPVKLGECEGIENARLLAKSIIIALYLHPWDPVALSLSANTSFPPKVVGDSPNDSTYHCFLLIVKPIPLACLFWFTKKIRRLADQINKSMCNNFFVLAFEFLLDLL
ncbi:hypothetical protein H5410_051045 [Solanum commersonii]|uniref:Uncharacterized protein n=1 Tax=Solanum commersonii TaxID=4109 RepID=A0A9J5WXB0_SOLCO|nr:hypothetical protein H5410_051045 [Solanum commersonii]